MRVALGPNCSEIPNGSSWRTPQVAEQVEGVIQGELAVMTAEDLGRIDNRDERLQVETPSAGRVGSLISELWSNGSRAHGRICGADLEAAVNAAYMGAARDASRTGTKARNQVVVTEERLRHALTNARRSISVDSTKRFLEEIQAHASEDVFRTFEAALAI